MPWRLVRNMIRNADSVIVIALAVLVAIGGLVGIVDIATIVNATLAALGLIAISLLRTHAALDQSKSELQRVNQQIATSFQAQADDILVRGSRDEDIVQYATQELLLVQETGSRIAETRKTELVSLLKQGGYVKIVVSSESPCNLGQLAFRNASLDQPTDLAGRASMFRNHIRGVAEKAGYKAARRLEVRRIPYSVDTTLTLVDTNHNAAERRIGVARLPGFQTDYAAKLSFSFDGRSSIVCNHFVDEFNRLFAAASKVVLLRGKPHSGKSTLLSEVVAQNQSPYMFYALTLEERHEGAPEQRSGFRIETSEGLSTRVAVRQGQDYSVVHHGLVEAMKQMKSSASLGRVIVWDEIGPIQAHVLGFVDLINQLIEDPEVTLIASICDLPEEPYLGMVGSPFSSVIDLDEMPKAVAAQILENELRSSLNTAIRKDRAAGDAKRIFDLSGFSDTASHQEVGDSKA